MVFSESLSKPAEVRWAAAVETAWKGVGEALTKERKEWADESGE